MHFMFSAKDLPESPHVLRWGLRVVARGRNWLLLKAEVRVPDVCLPLRTTEKAAELASNAGAHTPLGIAENTRNRQSSRINPERESWNPQDFPTSSCVTLPLTSVYKRA